MIKKGLIFVLILGILSSILAFYYLILPRDVFHWDESHHALYGMFIYEDIKTANWGKFWHDTGKQTLWSFLHSWVLGVWFLFFGLTYVSARAMSLLPFVGSIILTYLIAIRINREKGWIIGIIAALLMILSVPILDLATSCMIESLSIFCSLLFILVYLIALKKEKYGYFFLAGIFLGILALSKYQYGIVIGFAVGTLALCELFENRKLIKRWFQCYFSLFSGAFVVCALWFFTPPVEKKIFMIFWGWRKGAEMEAKTTIIPSFQEAIDYLFIIIKYSSFSYLMGVLLLVSLIYAIIYFRKRINIRILTIMIVIPLILFTLIKHHDVRYISILFPLMFVLFGFFLVDVFDRCKGYIIKYKRWVTLVGVLLSLVLLYGLIQFPNKAYNYVHRQGGVQKEPYSKQYKHNLEDVLDYFYYVIPEGQTVSVGFRTHFLTPYTFWFHFYGRFYYNSYFVINHPVFYKSRYFITIEVGEKSPYFTPNSDYYIDLAKWNAFLKRAEKEKRVALYSYKNFPDIGITAKIYKNLH